MRVALVAPLVSPIDDTGPPLGGAQAILADIAAGLAARGHDVSLLAVRGSRVRGATVVDLGLEAAPFAAATLDGTTARPDDDAQREGFARIAGWLRDHTGAWDVVHAHAYDAPAFDMLRGLPRTIHTLHLAPLDPHVVTAATEAERAGAILASVSRWNAGAWSAAGAPVAEVLWNGVDVEAIPFGRESGGPLLFAARMSPEKAPEVAIRVARAAGREILLAGGIYDRGHFEREIAPVLGPDARYVGALPRREVHALMARSSALLMPVRWDEPFGLAAVEAQAAGTPVVAYARGGIVEIVVDGTSGRLVAPDDETAFAAAIGRVGELDRSACRRNAARFGIDRMLDAHERLYSRVAGRNVSVAS